MKAKSLGRLLRVEEVREQICMGKKKIDEMI